MGNIFEIEIKELDSMKEYKYLGVEENHNTEYRNEKKLKIRMLRLILNRAQWRK
jgi:hypothetical protein